MTARCSNTFCDNSSLRNSELCVRCFKNGRLSEDPLILQGSSGVASGGGGIFTVGATGSQPVLTFESTGDIRLEAADGSDTWIQGISVYELEKTVLTQSGEINLLQVQMTDLRRDFERAVAVGHQTQMALMEIQREREAEKLGHTGLAGMFTRTFGVGRKTNG